MLRSDNYGNSLAKNQLNTRHHPIAVSMGDIQWVFCTVQWTEVEDARTCRKVSTNFTYPLCSTLIIMGYEIATRVRISNSRRRYRHQHEQELEQDEVCDCVWSIVLCSIRGWWRGLHQTLSNSALFRRTIEPSSLGFHERSTRTWNNNIKRHGSVDDDDDYEQNED